MLTDDGSKVRQRRVGPSGQGWGRQGRVSPGQGCPRTGFGHQGRVRFVRAGLRSSGQGCPRAGLSQDGVRPSATWRLRRNSTYYVLILPHYVLILTTDTNQVKIDMAVTPQLYTVNPTLEDDMTSLWHLHEPGTAVSDALCNALCSAQAR